MALSGTLDTFSLPDVMRLLASTTKSGRLRVSGPRESGSVWFADGDVADAELSGNLTNQPTFADVLFSFLRWETGSFTFEDDVHTDSTSSPQPTDAVLSQAEAMLVEWREIEKVVPSMELHVSLCRELSGPDVMVDAERWRGIAAVGSGSRVVEVARRLELNEVDSCRLIKDLIEVSLIEISEPAEPIEQEVVDSDSIEIDDDFVPDDLLAFDEDEPLQDFDDEPSIDPLLSAGDPLSDLEHFTDDPIGGGLFDGPSITDGTDEEALDPAEMARQLANLSPRAAKAVAEAARASTDAEREAALSEVEAEDETVNRSLLLRFLGSVDS